MDLLKVLKAISDETRYKLLILLLKHDLCVGALAIRLKISEAAVSQHLKVLRNADIVKGDKRGYYTHYYVERKLLEEAAQQIAELAHIVKADEKCHQNLSKNYSCSRRGGNKDVSRTLRTS